MVEKQIYRCRRCGKVLFHVNDGAVEVKKGKQYIKFLKNSGAVEARCDRCGKISIFNLEGNYAKR